MDISPYCKPARLSMMTACSGRSILDVLWLLSRVLWSSASLCPNIFNDLGTHVLSKMLALTPKDPPSNDCKEEMYYVDSPSTDLKSTLGEQLD